MSARNLSQNLAEHIVIVGGGAIGLASAWALCEKGVRVTVLEAGKAGEGALWASGGMLAAGFEACFELDPGHPLAASYADFLGRSLQLWRDWAPTLQARSGQALGYESQGSVTPAFTRAEVDRLDQAEALAKRFGVQATRVSGEALAHLEPALAKSCGALTFPHDGQLDNRALGRVLSDAVRSRGGEVVQQRRVTGLDRSAGQVRGVVLETGERLAADAVILATGAERFADMPAFAQMTPVKGQMIRFEASDTVAPKRVVRGLSIYLAAKSGGRLIAGASSEPGERSLETDSDTLERLKTAACAAMPALAGRPVVESWAGLRPCSSDAMPIVGETEPGLYLALGAYRNGVLTAPGMAELLLQALGADPGEDLARAFSPARPGLKA
jgi:glycine oxidase